jgi:thioredoxin-related protein
MSRWRRFLALSIISVLVLIGFACAREETATSKSPKAESPKLQNKREEIRWFGFNDALAKAKHESKPMFVEFYTDWCPYCKKFHKETLNDKQVAGTLAKSFISVRLDAEDPKGRIDYKGLSLNNVEFTRAFGVNSYPSLLFLEAGGEPITIIPGFVPAPQFLAILNYIDQKCYQAKVPLHEFVKRGNCV